MKCLVCNSEVEDVTTCPICGADIDLENIDWKQYPWLLIYTTNTLIDAEMFKANLESADIPVHILSQIDSTRQLTIGDLAIVKIYVPSIFEADAKAIIEQIESGSNQYITDIENKLE